MINQCVFVGRVTKVEGFKIELSVEDDNVIPLHLNEVLYESIKPVLKEGIQLAVKAKLQEQQGLLVPVVDRITYLQKERK